MSAHYLESMQDGVKNENCSLKMAVCCSLEGQCSAHPSISDFERRRRADVHSLSDSGQMLCFCLMLYSHSSRARHDKSVLVRRTILQGAPGVSGSTKQYG